MRRNILMHRLVVAVAFLIVVAAILCIFSGCDLTPGGTEQDKINTMAAANNLQANQPTPTDLNYSLERYNLIRRAYWVNGQREKANMLPCEIEKPLGYIVLFSGSAAVGSFTVDGKVSSLNSYLTPDSEKYATAGCADWMADVDGSYGENDSGIFFFTPDGKYIEWNGSYLYSDIPFTVDSPVLRVTEGGR